MNLIDEISKRWRHNLFNICVLLAIIGSISEIVIYIIDSNTTTLFLPHVEYRFRFIYIPSSLNLVVILITRFKLKSRQLSTRAKNVWACILIYFLCANTQFIHYVYGPLLVLPIVSIFVSVLFNNKLLTRLLGAASLLSLTGATCVAAFELRKDDPNLLADTGLAALIIVVSLIAANLLINYIDEQTNYITSSTILEKKLIDELHLDVLMGIYNRKALNERLLSITTPSGDISVDDFDNNPDEISGDIADDITDYFLLMFDIDDFKLVNDTYGHVCGDEVLQQLGNLLRKNNVLNCDAYRYGGEEIVVLFSGCSEFDALQSSTYLINAFSSIEFSFMHGGNITLSGGLAKYIPGQSATEWVNNADIALYSAKERGKNRVIAYSDSLRYSLQ